MSEQISPTLFCGITAEEVQKLKQQHNDMFIALKHISQLGLDKNVSSKDLLMSAKRIAGYSIFRIEAKS